MKKNLPTLLTGGVLAVIFLLLLFTFQVRQTEVAVVTRFGQVSRSLMEPGFNFRAPWPIEKIYKFENRVQNFERKTDYRSPEDSASRRERMRDVARAEAADAREEAETGHRFHGEGGK